MHSYAQTNIQLFNQLRHGGYSNTEVSLVRDAYELAMDLFTGRYQPSGKPFIAHVVGTASILASLRLSAQVVAAGLLHNVYEQGDFGNGRNGFSKAKREKIRRVLGSEVEEYVARFPVLPWYPQAIQPIRDNFEKLTLRDRNVVFLRLADALEHLLDLDVLYYGDPIGRGYVNNAKFAVEIAKRLGLSPLAAELKEVIRETESAERPVEIPERRNGSFVLIPKSCRKQFSVALRQISIWGVHRSHRVFRRTLTAIARNRAIGWIKDRKLRSFPLRRKSEEFQRLFPRPARMERVATGFQFTEGPVWIAEEKSLLFSDIPANQIWRVTSAGSVMVFRQPSGHSNGLTRDKEGRLIVCEHSNRRLTRTEKDGRIKPLAERFKDKKLNSPNDVIVKSNGAIYFTDPSYGIELREQEQPVQGVYRLSPDGQEISLVADDLARPNGLAFSPDEKKLYIDDSERRHIRVYEVQEDGSLSGGSLFHDMNISTPGSPDGMKVDVEGRVYCTGAGGVWVFDDTGKHLGTIVTPEKPSNCAWGDNDWRTLYITAVTSVYKIRVESPGIKVP